MSVLFPSKYTQIINELLSQLGYDLNAPRPLAKAVLELSDVYNSRKIDFDIWRENRFVAAYLVYFFPLNYLRATRTFKTIAEVGFWESLGKFHWQEMGAGCGAAYFAYSDFSFPHLPNSSLFNDISPLALNYFEKIIKKWNDDTSKNLRFTQQLDFEKNSKKEKSVFIASYSFNENPLSIEKLADYQSLVIIEPSTAIAARKLMSLRQQLIDLGFYAWGPCTHQKKCPLLTMSKKDWCFDRFFIELPDWYHEIENHLPMKNQSLTHSYLAMSRQPPPTLNSVGRAIGDTLAEKGKTRQAICVDDQRQFLSWLRRSGKPQKIPRGSLVDMSTYTLKGQEWRPNSSN